MVVYKTGAAHGGASGLEPESSLGAGKTASKLEPDRLPSMQQLRYFLAVGSQLSFRRAAVELSVSQPLLSRQIRALELDLGTTLARRSPSGVVLTEAGRVLFEAAQRILSDVSDTVQLVRRVAERDLGQVNVGYSPSAMNDVVAEVIARFRRLYPEVRLAIQESHRPTLLEDLRRGHLHVAFIRTNTGSPRLTEPLQAEVLLTEPRAAVLPVSHPLARRNRIALSDLENDPFVMEPRHLGAERFDYIMAACQAVGFTPRIAQEATSPTTVLALVAAGVGVSVLAYSQRMHRQRGVAFVPIVGLENELSVVWSQATLSPTADTFVSLARAVSGELPIRQRSKKVETR